VHTARYFFALLLVMSLPPAILLWYAIHPFVRFWRRLGPVWTYVVLSPLVVGLMLAVYLARHTLLQADLGTHYWLLIPTVLCLGFGGWIAWHRRKQLTQRMITGVAELSRDPSQSKLLTEGAYAVIRHPRYVEVVLWSAGYAFFANYLASYIAVLLAIPALYVVVLLEERELRDRFGSAYEEYARRVPRFVPRLGGRKAPADSVD
jgi:protein-S-isoprenylcysteine O-methyltransferase Ste14